MSHHFDTPTVKEDPRLNLCDFYLFEGPAGHTVMALTVNPDAGRVAPDSFRDEGIYAFRFDLNGDAREEVTFKVRFSAVEHADAAEHEHVQTVQVKRATGAQAAHGDGGTLIFEGQTGTVQDKGGIRMYAGLAPDLFAGDAFALHGFMDAYYKEQRYNPEAFQHRQNYFDRRNVTAIVLEVPDHLIGRGPVHAWATVSLYGHAPEVQVSRWGLPLITHLFLNDPGNQEVKEAFNRAVPANDVKDFAALIGAFTEKMVTIAASVPSPGEYSKQVMARLCPATLPYEIGTEAAFDHVGFNGRALGDDVMDIMLTIASNRPLGDGVAPDRKRIKKEFPYFGAPYETAEQAGLTPPAHNDGK